MPCSPLDSSDFDSGEAPPGFDLGLGSISMPDLNIPFPALPLDQLKELFDLLGMILPGGTIKPSFHPGILNNLYAGIKDLLDKFFPFLMIYKFFLPILNLILCIIEILCAIPNTFKLIRALIKLFRVCIPEFLALFPIFAIILMIISLILLIIALIEYIITQLIIIIETILRNIIILSKAAAALNNDSIIAIVKKIGDLLCILQNLFILFALFNTIIQVIKALLKLSFKIPPCDSSDGTDDGCCSTDVCPQFIKENETIVSSTGIFKYTPEVKGALYTDPVLRNESWQFYDISLAEIQRFINITNAWDLPAAYSDLVFFPEGITYTDITRSTGTPYYISFRFYCDPAAFGQSGAARYFKIKNAIVKEAPTDGLSGWDSTILFQGNRAYGTLNLLGGKVTEDNDTEIINPITGIAFNIRDYFSQPTVVSVTLPGADDTLDTTFTDLTYTFTVNHAVLATYGLITIGCIPSVARERDFLAATLGAQFSANAPRLIAIADILPDTDAAQQCIDSAITTYRTKISTATTLKFKQDILTCLDTLRASSVASVVEAISIGYDRYKSSFVLDPTIQFTSSVIKLKVLLNESSGTNMTANLPADIAALIAAKLSASSNFGEIKDFTYDGVLYFVADISSLVAGNGAITVSFEMNTIGTLTTPTDLTIPATVTIKSLTYTFVKSQVLGGNIAGGGGAGDSGNAGVNPDGSRRGDEGSSRRDETDIGGKI